MIPHDVDALTSMSCLLVMQWVSISCGSMSIRCKSNTAHHHDINSLIFSNCDNDSKPNRILLQHAQRTKNPENRIAFACPEAYFEVYIYSIHVCVYANLFCLSVCPSARAPVCPSARMSVCPYVRLPVCPSVHLSIFLPWTKKPWAIGALSC